MKLHPLVAALGIASCVTACTALESHDINEATRAALAAAEQLVLAKQLYCSEPNQVSREIILESIRRVDPGYVGICDPSPKSEHNLND